MPPRSHFARALIHSRLYNKRFSQVYAKLKIIFVWLILFKLVVVSIKLKK